MLCYGTISYSSSLAHTSSVRYSCTFGVRAAPLLMYIYMYVYIQNVNLSERKKRIFKLLIGNSILVILGEPAGLHVSYHKTDRTKPVSWKHWHTRRNKLKEKQRRDFTTVYIYNIMLGPKVKRLLTRQKSRNSVSKDRFATNALARRIVVYWRVPSSFIHWHLHHCCSYIQVNQPYCEIDDRGCFLCGSSCSSSENERSVSSYDNDPDVNECMEHFLDSLERLLFSPITYGLYCLCLNEHEPTSKKEESDRRNGVALKRDAPAVYSTSLF